ncbi:hypothetical protein FBU30_000465 [Linnemannia zychae]|nr:hypothetical protein FBU30_000465 [Linnemannia zychae]
MVSFSLKGLILSASLATLAVITQAAPIPLPPSPPPSSPPPPLPPSHLDACGILASTSIRNITHQKVSDCYMSIPFNREAAQATYDSVLNLFNDFYTFRDSALAPTLAAPFSSAPVDIIEKINTVGRGNYTSDYQFHTDLRLALFSLFDAHASYGARCYMSYTFYQDLDLYAPVVNGKQEIRVFADSKHRKYEDCVVRTIDGQDALTHIHTWADKYVYYAKDPGVRLNQALTTQAYVRDDMTFKLDPGEFSMTRRLPERAYVDYELQCGNSTSVIPVRDNWVVLPATEATFHDAASFVENVCLARPSEPTSAKSLVALVGKYHPEVPRNEKHVRPQIDEAISADPALPGTAAIPPDSSLPGATLIGNANGTVVFQLKDHPQTGVLVVPSHELSVDDDELDNIYNNLMALKANGVTNLIIDMQGNGGGYVVFASRLVQMFFPNTDVLDTALPANLRVPASIEALAQKSFNTSWGDFYRATQFYDMTDKTFYKNNDLFTKPIPSTRYGRTANYSEMTTYLPHSLNVPPELFTLPWTNQPDRIRILTDGRCGSSCSQSAIYFTKYKKVKSYAIGGSPGQPLSLSSFPGGAVGELADLPPIFAAANMESPVKPLPYDGTARYTSLEVFFPGSEIALDYDGAVYGADFRLDYTPQNSRNRAVMWNEVAAHAWS